MPAIVSNKLRLYNARNFVKSFDVEALPGPPSTAIYPIVDNKYSNTSIYFFIGRTHSWDSSPDAKAGYSDNNPPPVDLTFSNIEYEPWRSMTSLKKLTSSDVMHQIKRTNWTSGTVYGIYDDASESVVNQSAGANAYHVFSSTEQAVFMCLDNNDGAMSVDVPTVPSAGFLANSFVTSNDGYRWKFMYDISFDISDKFLMTNYVPVHSLTKTELDAATAPTGWTKLHEVQKNAVDGALETIIIEPGKRGTNYRGATGTVAGVDSISSAVKLKLDSQPGGFAANELNGTWIYLSNGSFNSLRQIATGPTEASLTNVIVTPAITGLNPLGSSTTTTYVIGPEIVIEGDGTGALAYSELTGSTLKSIKIANSGISYSTVNATVNGVPAGSGATIRAIIPPKGGYGADPTKELGGYYASVAVTLDGRGIGNNLPLGSAQYRQLGVIRNPTINTGAYVANGTAYRQMTKLVINADATSTFTYTPAPKDKIIGESSGATAIVVDYALDFVSGPTTNKALRITNITTNSLGGGFIGSAEGSSEIIAKIESSGAPGTGLDSRRQIDQNVPTEQPELLKNSGEIFYLENRRPISRTVDQKEDFKIIIEF